MLPERVAEELIENDTDRSAAEGTARRQHLPRRLGCRGPRSRRADRAVGAEDVRADDPVRGQKEPDTPSNRHLWNHQPRKRPGEGQRVAWFSLGGEGPGDTT